MTGQETPYGYQCVARYEELPDAGYLTTQVGEYSVLVAKFADGVFAIENLCSHARSQLVGGRFRLGRISCPLHGVIFDFRTGSVLGGTLTTVALRTFATSVVDGVVCINSVPNDC
ncbi:MAG: Rieske 2Fe-2S domain-containing protein [Gammaproteobacteria bacterium]|nr:Rieske 2Fe-2S domain-containing protein [Gammaproteobacteria bacterium]